MSDAHTHPRDLLIGTYTTGRAAEGLYWATADDDGGVRIVSCLALDDPSFVALHPRLPLAYVLSELPDGDGTVATVAIDREKRALRVVASASAAGHLPCHAVVAPDGTALWVANYGSGTVAIFALDRAGALAETPIVLRHEGRSQHPRRQAAPHPHCVALHPNGRDVYVTDLGTDRLEHYRCGGRTIERAAATATAAGAGPRHLCIAREGRFAALSCELDNTVRLFAVGGDGALAQTGSISSLPEGFPGRSYASEIALHPSGAMLYVGNRGHDSIACIAIRDGVPGAIVHAPTHGAHPRHFAVAPAGDRLVVGNRDGDNVASYRLDTRSGAVAMPATVSAAPAPAFVCWL